MTDLLVGLFIDKILKLRGVPENLRIWAVISWLFNPFTFTIGTRGNCEPIVCAAILWIIISLLNGVRPTSLSSSFTAPVLWPGILGSQKRLSNFFGFNLICLLSGTTDKIVWKVLPTCQCYCSYAGTAWVWAALEKSFSFLLFHIVLTNLLISFLLFSFENILWKILQILQCSFIGVTLDMYSMFSFSSENSSFVLSFLFIQERCFKRHSSMASSYIFAFTP